MTVKKSFLFCIELFAFPLIFEHVAAFSKVKEVEFDSGSSPYVISKRAQAPRQTCFHDSLNPQNKIGGSSPFVLMIPILPAVVNLVSSSTVGLAIRD